VGLVEHLEWNGLHSGDPVKVREARGVFTFRAFVINEANGAEWVEVFGGKRQHEKQRYFAPARIQPVRKSRRSR
jgi:hypothetical protein